MNLLRIVGQEKKEKRIAADSLIYLRTCGKDDCWLFVCRWSCCKIFDQSANLRQCRLL